MPETQASPLGPVVTETGAAVSLDFCLGRIPSGNDSLRKLKAQALSGRSRVARLMLSKLACPSDPESLLRPGSFEPGGRLYSASAVVLATVLGTQPLEPWHRRRALEVYDRLLDEGNEIVNGAHQGMHAQLMLHAGQIERLRETLATYRNIDRVIRRALEVELKALDPEESQVDFIEQFKRFAGWADLETELRDVEAPLLDRISLHGLPPVHGGQRVSIVMTCFQPDAELFTAIRSVRNQTWQNWELLLVDDASGPEYDQMLDSAADLDDRIRVLRRERNGGTYAARNEALKAATGVFVTGLDSDDWAHPRWIEAMVEPLTRSREVRMSYSEGIRATSDLRLIVSPGRRLTEIRSTSIMYRRLEVLPELGFFHPIRKGADSEFRFRMVRKFGAGATRAVPGRHTIVRQHEGTLSKNEIGEGWLHPARQAYESSYRHWHSAIQTGKSGAYLGEDAEVPLYAPARLASKQVGTGKYDVLFAADWRGSSRPQRMLLNAAEAAVAEGRTVALVHYARPWTKTEVRAPIAAPVLEFAAELGLEFVDPREAECKRVVVTDPELREAFRYEFADASGAATEVLLKSQEPKPAPAPAPAAARRRPRSRSLRLRNLAAIPALAGIAAIGLGAALGYAEPSGMAVAVGGLAFATGAAAVAARALKAKISAWL